MAIKKNKEFMMIASMQLYRNPQFLVKSFEEKILQIETCLSHSSDLIQEIDTLMDKIEAEIEPELDEKISEAKAFIYTGQDDIGELREIYQELKEGKFQQQQQDLISLPFCGQPLQVTKSSLPDLKYLIQEFEEKMLQTKVCLFHGHSRLQELANLAHEDGHQDLEEKIVKAKDFMGAGNKDMEQLREIYQTLTAIRPFNFKEAA